MSLGMLNRSIASMAGRAPGGTYDVQEYFWGAELSKDKSSFTWNPEADEELGDEMQNILFLKRAILGLKATEGERNVVEVHCKNFDDDEVQMPILSLTLGQQDHCDVELTFKQVEAVTFKLIAGSGPIHLVGQHYQETIRDPDMDDDDEDEEEDEVEAETEPAGKKRKADSPLKPKGAEEDASMKKYKTSKSPANGKSPATKVKA